MGKVYPELDFYLRPNYPKRPKKAIIVNKVFNNYNSVLPYYNSQIINEVNNDGYCKICSAFMILFIVISCVCVLVYVN